MNTESIWKCLINDILFSPKPSANQISARIHIKEQGRKDEANDIVSITVGASHSPTIPQLLL
jgi:hypothetical protein